MSGKDNCEVKKTLVKPADLPIYDVITNDAQVKAKPEEPNAAVQAVKTVRLAITDGLKQVEAAKGQVDHVLETGKAHTECKRFLITYAHYSKSQIFVQKFSFDKTPTFSRVFRPNNF